MFNPEMMKKYSEVGVKVQQLQMELAQTEVECATKDGGVVVKVSGTQVRPLECPRPTKPARVRGRA
jgi:DNA-binding protein YbaB